MGTLTEDMASPRRDELRRADLLAIIGRYNDVTERLRHSHDALGREVCRLHQELQQKNKELQRKERLAALGEMAAGVAHEIRNPLGAIHLYASLLERDLSDRPLQLDLVQRLEVGIVNLESIVGDILAFAGDIEPRTGNVSLGEIMEHVLAQAQPQAQRRAVRIAVDGAAGSAVLCCDAAQIQRALVNLVVNAVEAVEKGGHVWISAAASNDGREAHGCGDCRILVSDDGPGVDPEHLHRVFNPFFTTKHTGTGLGLAIVHRIAEANGGSVCAENREGGGAVFVLTVPSGEPLAKSAPAARRALARGSENALESCA